MASIGEVKGQLDTHEAVCAERYLGINARLKRIEVGLIAGASALIGAMGWAINLLIGLVAKL
jgi:hypothetical protein